MTPVKMWLMPSKELLSRTGNLPIYIYFIKVIYPPMIILIIRWVFWFFCMLYNIFQKVYIKHRLFYAEIKNKNLRYNKGGRSYVAGFQKVCS